MSFPKRRVSRDRSKETRISFRICVDSTAIRSRRAGSRKRTRFRMSERKSRATPFDTSSVRTEAPRTEG